MRGWIISGCLGGLLLASVARAETNTYALFFDGQRCGYSLTRREVQGDRVQHTETLHLKIQRMGIPLEMTVTEQSTETLDGRPLAFHLEQDLALMKMQVDGTIAADGTMTVVTTNAGQQQTRRMAFPAGAVMSEGLRRLSRSQGLREGTTYRVAVFTPSAMQAITMQFRVGPRRSIDLLGRVVEAVEVVSEYELAGAGRLVSTSYVDDDYQLLKSTIPVAGVQIEMIAAPEAFALSEAGPAEMVATMMVPSPRALPRLDRLEAVTYWLAPKDPNDRSLNVPTTDNQTAERQPDGRIRLTVRPSRPDPTAAYPYRGDDPVARAALEPTRYLQSDAPEIRALAERATAGCQSAWQAAQAIERFVGDYIEEKNLSVGYATALEVCHSRQGDCTEHAVLTAALCRAVGIPARVVVGVAYVDEFMGTLRCFGGHAWTEAYVGDRWIGLDAAFRGSGRGGHDPGHLALAVGNGEPTDFFGLLGSLGRFTVERIEIGGEPEGD